MREYKILLLNKLYPPYWDDGIKFHRSRGKQTRKKWSKEIRLYERRMYRTWKYNRRTKYKNMGDRTNRDIDTGGRSDIIVITH